MKRESEGETTFKMFLPHERHDMAGSQTALAECRRAWDHPPKDLNLRNIQKIKKFLKRESEGETTFKMFLPHERHDMTGSQTALAECRRAWDHPPKDLNLRNIQKIKKFLKMESE